MEYSSQRSTPPNLNRTNSFWVAASKTDSFKKLQVPTSEIVYLDADFRSYKYFLTGEFDIEGQGSRAALPVLGGAKII